MSIRDFACACAITTLTLLAAGTAHAQTASTPQPTVVTAAEVKQEPGQPAVLSAQLKDQSGRVLGKQVLRFYVNPRLFGPDTLMAVGQATTDGTGTAKFPYTPTWVGDIEAVATFAGTSDLAASQARFQLQAVGPVKVHENAAFGLQLVRGWMPAVVAFFVAAVWGTFVIVVARLAFAMRGEPPRSPLTTGERVGAKS